MALQLSPCQQEDHITCLAISSDSSILASGSLDHSISYSSPSSPVSTPYIIPRAHDSPVLCLCWSSLQFGNILASGSADGSIKLWISSQDETRRSWKSTALLSEARGSIRKIEFSPSEFGLKLATISGDSTLRIYECFDTSKLVEWALVEEIDLSNNYPSSTTSLSTGSGPIKGFDPASPSKQTSSNPINLSPGSSSIGTIERKVSNIESAGGWSLAWCKEAWWGERIAVSSGTSGIIRLFHLPSRAPWSNYLNLVPPRGSASTSPIASLAWSPSSGRSFQLIAAGRRDGSAEIWKVVTPDLDLADGTEGSVNSAEWTATLDSELVEDRRSTATGSVVVDFNSTGTVVSTNCDGRVRLWKSFGRAWRVIASLTAEEEF